MMPILYLLSPVSVLAVLAIGLPSPAVAASVGQVLAGEVLGDTTSLRCAFDRGIQADWKSGEATVQSLDGEDFGFQIDNVNVADGTARIIGNAGAADLIIVAAEDVVHFLEHTPLGGLNLTTVFPSDGRRDGRVAFPAVHSRHLNLGGLGSRSDPFPSQRYGRCVAWD